MSGRCGFHSIAAAGQNFTHRHTAPVRHRLLRGDATAIGIETSAGSYWMAAGTPKAILL
jgi:hypothetical protein